MKYQTTLAIALALLSALTSPGATNPSPKSPPETLSIDLGNKLSLEFILIHPGKFIMGTDVVDDDRASMLYTRQDARPSREVTLTKAYYLGKYEITQDQFMTVMSENPSKYKGGRRPVEMVSWNVAMEFCQKMSAKLGRTVRLATEAEFQYAFRAGTTTRFFWGDTIKESPIYAWSRSNVTNDETAEVGLLKPNPWGFYDIAGNVMEWVSDFYDENGYAGLPTVDPVGRPTGTKHVLCGGSKVDIPMTHWHSWRAKLTPENKSNRTGLRVVVLPEENK